MGAKEILTIALTVLAVVGWLGLAAPHYGNLQSNPIASPLPGNSTATGNPTPTTPSSGGQNIGATMAAKALAATRAAGVNPDMAYLPHPSASPAQIAEAAATGASAPLYTGDPAPMGIADYGLTGSGNGATTPSVLNTTALQAYIAANATGIEGADLYQAQPDSYSIQLNAVLTNITLFGTPGYQFWTQDVMTFFPATGFMILVTNVWNFSAPMDNVSAPTIFSHGPYGHNDYSSLGFYYANYTIPYRVSYPFVLTLTMNSSLWDGRNNVSFSAALTSDAHPSEAFTMDNYDWVVFNSTTPVSPRPVTTPSNYTADGRGFNHVLLWDDYELVVCGPGGGSQVDLSTADANLALAYYTGTTYLPIPSAYNYGSDTGETSTGANVAWSNDSLDSPGGIFIYDFATMTTGPSILTGLWNTGAPEGSYPLTVAASPGNLFSFFNYTGAPAFTNPIVSEWDYAPSMEANTYFLMPGVYSLDFELADYSPMSETVTITGPGPMTVTVILTQTPYLGVYTPQWAFSNAEIGALAQSGEGTPTNPYVLYNNQYSTLSSEFGLYNDYAFPVFPGVFLMNTNASVELNNSPSFLTATNDFQSSPGDNLSQTNNLQYWFWNVSGVALNYTNVSGWFGLENYFPLTYNSFNVIFYESQDNLVSNNLFLTEGQGLLMYASGSLYGTPRVDVGGNNTVWGNEFVQSDPPISCPDSPCLPLLPYNSGLGLEIGEGYDLIYNNLVATPTTAWLLPLDLYSEFPILWPHDVWNITPEVASATNYALFFPRIPLSGSIVGGSTQGGNSWWDYGLALNWANGADNPTSSIPYDENARNLLDPLPGYQPAVTGYGCTSYYCSTYIYPGPTTVHPGGDYVPLTTIASTVTLGPHGLVGQLSTYGLSITCGPAKGGGGGPAKGGGGGPAKGGGGGACTGGSGTSGNTGGSGMLPAVGGDPAPILIDQVLTDHSSVNLVLPDGEYNWTPIVPAGYTSTTGGSFEVIGNTPVSLTIDYAPVGSGVVTFSESGLPSGLTWAVTVGATTMSLTTDGGIDYLYFTEVNGVYSYSVATNPGWGQSTLSYSGSLTVDGGPVTEPTLLYSENSYDVTFEESGLPAADLWYVNVTSGPSLSTTGATGVLSTYLADGSYSFLVATNDKRYEPSGFSPSPFVVSGAPVTVSGSFSLVTYAVTFTESGLSSGTTWSVTAGATTESSTETTITFPEANGTYSYTVAAVTGYSASPSSGSLTVAGAPAALTVSFTPVSTGLTVTPGQGPVSSNVTVSGSGFSPSTAVTLVFDGVTISSCSSGSLKSTATGTFSCTLRVPSGTSGTTVTATGSGGVKETGTFTVTALKFSVAPSLGPVGATVTAAGTGFSVTSTVGLVFDGVTVSKCATGSLLTNSTGAFGCTFTVPAGTKGTTVTATDAGGQKSTSAFLVTTPAIVVAPNQGPIGATLVLAGAGFSVSSKVGVVFDGVTISSCKLGSLTTGSAGLFACTFGVPSGTSGTTVTATDVGGAKATATFTVTTPKITLSASSGAVGSSVTVSGTGFSVLGTVALVFDGVTVSSCKTGSLTTGGAGTFSCSFKVPSGTSGTTVTATDPGGQVAVGKFTVT